MRKCQPKQIAYDPATCPDLTDEFVDVENPTLIELGSFYALTLLHSDRCACDGDQLGTFDEAGTFTPLATLYDGSLVRSIEDAWCPSLNLFDCPESVCESGCTNKSVKPYASNCKPCDLPTGKPFQIYWPYEFGDDEEYSLIAELQVGQSTISSQLVPMLDEKPSSPDWLHELATREKVEAFEADFHVDAGCVVSEPIILTAGWWKITACALRDINGQTKRKLIGTRYIRLGR